MQLTSYKSLTSNKNIFKEAKYYKVKDSKIKYKRIPMKVKYQNEKKDRLIIETPLLFSFGVNEDAFGLKIVSQILKKKHFLKL